jgi:hypothetical protein
LRGALGQVIEEMQRQGLEISVRKGSSPLLKTSKRWNGWPSPGQSKRTPAMPLRRPDTGSFESLLQEVPVEAASLVRLSKYPKTELYWSRGRYR